MNKTTNIFIKILASLMMLVAVQVSAQNMHIIGDEAIETNYPPNTQVFDYVWSTMMYTSEEAGGAKTITKIAIDQTTDYDGYWEYAMLENQKVYVKLTTDDDFGTLAYEDPENSANGYTKVFEGTVQFNLGWSEITLSTPLVYDGTSSIIIHYENHRGTTAPIVNVKFNASTISGDLFKTVGGDDNFPTEFGTFLNQRPNVALIYNGDGPATPVNPTPANNSYKTLVDTDLEFFIGDNTSSYDVYFGTTNPPTQVLQADVAVSGSGTYSINPSDVLGNLLEPHTRYYWQIVAKDGGATASSQVWNIYTQGVIQNFPYYDSFEDQPINPLYYDTIDWAWPISGPANWGMLDYDAFNGTYSIACNVWSETVDEFSLVSPRMYLPANQRAKFRWKLDNGDPSVVNMYFDITTDGGSTWVELHQFQPEAAMEEWEELIVNLTGYEGNDVHLRWRFETTQSYSANYFKFDDLIIENAPTTAVIQIDEPNVDFPPLAVGGVTYLPLEVTNTGVADLNITGSTMAAPYSFTAPDPIAPGESAIVYINMEATATGDFYQNFEFTGNYTGNGHVDLTGSVYQIDYNFYENADVSLDLPENWNVIRTADPYDEFTNVEIQETGYDAYSAPNAFRMLKMNDIVSPLMLITEGVGGYNANSLTFYAKKNYPEYDCVLQIGTTNDPFHAEAFTAVHTIELTNEYQFFEFDLPSSTTDPYIAFKFLNGQYSAAIWMDDISWDEQGAYPPYCPTLTFPLADASDIDVMMGLELTWASAGGNPTGYILSYGTNPEANNILDAQDVGDVISYQVPTIPAYGSDIYWKVIAYNTHGESTGCGTYTFSLMNDPVVTVPYSENFDDLDAFAEQMYPLGYSHENANNDNFPWDVISDVATPGMAHTTPNAMHMLFSLSQMNDYLFTPPVYLAAGTNYDFSFWFRTMGDAWVPEPIEKLKVFLGTDNNSAAMTTEIFKNENLTNQEWQKATISFEVAATGEYFFSFYGFSDPSQGLLLVDDVAIDLSISVADIEKSNVSIYPNPATNLVNIKSIEDVENVKIYNMSGSLVYEESYQTNEINLETSSLTTGAYMLVLETKKETIRRKLIIK